MQISVYRDYSCTVQSFSQWMQTPSQRSLLTSHSAWAFIACYFLSFQFLFTANYLIKQKCSENSLYKDVYTKRLHPGSRCSLWENVEETCLQKHLFSAEFSVQEVKHALQRKHIRCSSITVLWVSHWMNLNYKWQTEMKWKRHGNDEPSELVLTYIWFLHWLRLTCSLDIDPDSLQQDIFRLSALVNINCLCFVLDPWCDLFSIALWKQVAGGWRAGSWHQQHVPLFTDMSVIDQYVINQSSELANNTTYMREAKPLG